MKPAEQGQPAEGQLKETQDPFSSIYSASRLCLMLFDECIGSTDDAGNEGYSILEELRGQFSTWAAYVGAFATPKASLDARLAPHEDLGEMILDLLAMVIRNLRWSTANQQIDANSEHHVGLPAVESAITKLFTLAVSIRRAGRKSHKLSQRGKDKSFESNCSLLLQIRYPNARQSLRNQLMSSISARGMSLHYLQQHNRKIARDADNAHNGTEENEEIRTKDDGSQAQAKADNQPAQTEIETLASEVSRSVVSKNREVAKRNFRPSSSIISHGSTVRDASGSELPYPPIPRPNTQQKYCSCTICSEPFEMTVLTEEKWKAHVDRDIEPYVCISEECSETLRFFTRMQDWVEHMQTRHSMDWAARIHTELWYCDVNHSDPLEFSNRDIFVKHMKEEHAKDLTNSQLQGRIRRNRRVAKREPFACPLCDCIPEDLKERVTEKPYKPLFKHIARHLKYVSFWSMSYLDTSPENANDTCDSVVISEEQKSDTPSRVSTRSSVSFTDIPATEILGNGSYRIGEQIIFQEYALQSDETWDFLPFKSLETDWEHLARHLRRLDPMSHSGERITMRDELISSFQRNPSGHGKSFLPYGEFMRITHFGTVLDSLATVYPEATARRLANFINGPPDERKYYSQYYSRRIFSILVLIHRVELMEPFESIGLRDHHLPFYCNDGITKLWPYLSNEGEPLALFDTVDQETRQSFYNFQWYILTHYFHKNLGLRPMGIRVLHPKTVLPLTSVSIISHNTKCVKIHPDHHEFGYEQFCIRSFDEDVTSLQPHQSPIPKRFDDYLAMNPCKNIAELLTVLKMENKVMILLPWARGGSLRKLFNLTPDDWAPQKSPFLLVKWLASECLGLETGQCWPQNSWRHINRRDFAFFGDSDLRELGSLKFANCGIDDLSVYRQAYRSPEHDLHGADSHLTAKVDIWSLGCVFTELLTWIIRRDVGVENYRMQRIKEAAYRGHIETERWHEDNFFMKEEIIEGVLRLFLEKVRGARQQCVLF
ncbi:hypothetical protein PT974_04447 [Cladobotryum mycophilum]|uniref:Protein kinase domain-containing protein n=1 Tax=Cladobotryum mycophilum TaxID=491253 RepID=A0ABR0SV63_9HYPO